MPVICIYSQIWLKEMQKSPSGSLSVCLSVNSPILLNVVLFFTVHTDGEIFTLLLLSFIHLKGCNSLSLLKIQVCICLTLLSSSVVKF